MRKMSKKKIPKANRLPKQKVVKLANSAWMWVVIYPKIKLRR